MFSKACLRQDSQSPENLDSYLKKYASVASTSQRKEQYNSYINKIEAKPQNKKLLNNLETLGYRSASTNSATGLRVTSKSPVERNENIHKAKLDQALELFRVTLERSRSRSNKLSNRESNTSKMVLKINHTSAASQEDFS